MKEQTQDIVHVPIVCTKCNYNLAGLDLAGVCPECGKSILDTCFWCDYDLTGTSPESNCPECGVSAISSIGVGVFATAPDDLLKSIHTGFRLVTMLILVYIVWIIVTGILFATAFARLDNTTLNLVLIPVSIISNSLVLAIVYGWWKLAAPIPGLPEAIDGSGRRKFLNVSLAIFAVLTVIAMFVSFVPSNLDPDAPFETIDYVNSGLGLISLLILLVIYVAQMRYLQWFSKIVKNKKMHKRSKNMVWSGPLVAALGLLAFLIGPLLVLIFYWNMLEYLRQNVKAIRKHKNAIA